MKLCFPVQADNGLQSKVFGHFGSAPAFLVVDATDGTVSQVINRDLGHAHGACNPMRALGGQAVDAVVVGGIGQGALMGLGRAGVQVFEARGETVAENVAAWKSGTLRPWPTGRTCGGHGHAQGCGHHGPARQGGGCGHGHP